MSKAFTKETDDAPEDEVVSLPPSASLPPGTKNYLTAAGAQRFRAELEALSQDEQATGADNLSGEQKDQRRRRKRRMAEIEHTLRSAEVVPLPVGYDAKTKVVFRATVTVREARSGEKSQYQIVGVDEVDFGGDRVSLYAPIARALLNARIGDRVRFRFPAGEEELEIVAVVYEQ